MKMRDREQEERPPPVDVGQLAVQRRGDRRRDEERRGRPRLQVEAVQVVGDGPGGRGHDGLVQRGQEHAHHQADQNGDDLPMGEFRGRLGGRASPSAGAVVLGLLTRSPVVLRPSRTQQRLDGAVEFVEEVGEGVDPSPAGQSLSARLSSALRASCICWQAARPASVIASREARPSTGSASRRARPALTSCAACRLTVDGSACLTSARSVTRIGPRCRSGNSSIRAENSAPRSPVLSMPLARPPSRANRTSSPASRLVSVLIHDVLLLRQSAQMLAAYNLLVGERIVARISHTAVTSVSASSSAAGRAPDTRPAGRTACPGSTPGPGRQPESVHPLRGRPAAARSSARPPGRCRRRRRPAPPRGRRHIARRA